MFCKNCGAQLKEDYAFCNKCGAKVEAESVTSAASTSASQTEFPQAVEVNQQPECGIYRDCEQYMQPKKKGKRAWLIAVSVLLTASVLFALLCTSFSPIQVISSKNSPLNDLTKAMANTYRDGYEATTTITRYEYKNGEYVERDVSEAKGALGVLDMETGVREFTMSKSENYMSYETPEYSLYHYSSSVEGNLRKQEAEVDSSIDMVKALSARNYKELASYLNANWSGIFGLNLDVYSPLLDESGFHRAMRKINRRLKNGDLEDVFGYEKSKSGGEITYTFEYNLLEVMEWYRTVFEENPKAFRNDEAYECALKGFDYRIARLEESGCEEYYKYEIVIEDGYVVSQTMENELIYEDGSKSKYVSVTEFDEWGDASADSDVLAVFKERKSQLGMYDRINWSDDEYRIYDEDGNVVKRG